ncbi:hypothetical protein MES5069_680012 [Mesorhizobium escarrei]|uniref:Integrase n=1 Tax=Mesorhizobium escarrei TaxID=666018 RepID=A0ABN8KDH9_9HYPH|nr:hypothetical protein MES5069_680012 [Mesorhizobium escarrei]
MPGLVRRSSSPCSRITRRNATVTKIEGKSTSAAEEANRYINMDDLREHKKLALRQAE